MADLPDIPKEKPVEVQKPKNDKDKQPPPGPAKWKLLLCEHIGGDDRKCREIEHTGINTELLIIE